MLSLPAETTIDGLKTALFPLLLDPFPGVSKGGDYTFTPRIPREPSDIRIFGFTGEGSWRETESWERELAGILSGGKWREDWMLWRVSQSLGENRFDEECGDEMEGNEVIGVSLRSKPGKLWDDRNDEVFGYYDVCEAYDSSKEVVYVNVIKEDEFEELAVQPDEPCFCETVVRFVDEKPSYRGTEKVAYCVQEGEIVRVESPRDIVRYGVNHTDVSSLVVQCFPQIVENSVQCVAYVLGRLTKNGLELSLDHIPRYFFVQPTSTSLDIWEYLCRVFHLPSSSGEFLYLDPYSPLDSPHAEWERILLDSKALGDCSLEGLFGEDTEDSTEEMDEVDHPPCFAIHC